MTRISREISVCLDCGYEREVHHHHSRYIPARTPADTPKDIQREEEAKFIEWLYAPSGECRKCKSQRLTNRAFGREDELKEDERWQAALKEFRESSSDADGT